MSLDEEPWFCSDCNETVARSLLRPGNRCSICGGARTVPVSGIDILMSYDLYDINKCREASRRLRDKGHTDMAADVEDWIKELERRRFPSLDNPVSKE